VSMKRIGISMGDSSGVGPEILLKAAREKLIRVPYVVYGDLVPLREVNRQLGMGLEVHPVSTPAGCVEGHVNVIDQRMLSANELTPGRINAKSGQAAREYVVRATKATLAGEIAALATLPMNKEATQLTDPGFTGHVTLELSNVATLPIMLYPGMKIGQLCLFRLSSPAEHPYGSEKYGSRYQGQRGPTPSRSFANFHRTHV